MEWLFGKKETPEDQLKKNQQLIRRSIREIERERNKLQLSEKKLIIDIKKNAKMGQMNAARIMAKDLVRTRNYVKKLFKTKTFLQALNLRLQTVKSQHAMTSAMKGAVNVMIRMNKQIDLESMTRIIMEFERQNDIMEAKEESVIDFEDLDVSDEDEETEEIINQVLDEIGINLKNQLADAPTKKDEEVVENDDTDILQRIENLKRD